MSAHDAGPRVADVALSDQVRALHNEVVQWVYQGATLPVSTDTMTALGWYIERTAAATRLLSRVNVLLLRLEADNG